MWLHIVLDEDSGNGCSIAEFNSLGILMKTHIYGTGSLTKSSQKRPETAFLNLIIHLPPFWFAGSWPIKEHQPLATWTDIQHIDTITIKTPSSELIPPKAAGCHPWRDEGQWGSAGKKGVRGGSNKPRMIRPASIPKQTAVSCTEIRNNLQRVSN
jgi:hypothetical protein